ncbi:MAG: XrtA system polysaccharide chain length determinant [Thermodesulfobacteriota bacterium]|nr:XrtA system polysaccharide chain length determinant [Thermodesulfobacteriota bacterium]
MATEQGGQKPFDIYLYLSLLLRRKWEIIFCMIPFLLAGLLYCLFSAKIYSTSTTIVVVPQRVPVEYVRSTVTGDIDERVRGIWQEVTSRTSLERIIEQFNLYPEIRERLPMETVVGEMRKKIQIDSPRSARSNTFTLSYEGADPILITRVVNALANMFIEENLKLREMQARGTAEFLSEELEKVYSELKHREEDLKQYKMEHMGELPEQSASNLVMLQRFQEELGTLQENIRSAEDRRLLLQRQLAEEKSILRATAPGVVGPQGDGAAPHQAPTTLEGLRERLKSLRTRYTDTHPDVVIVKKLVAKLEKEQEIRNESSDKEDAEKGEDMESPVDVGASENAIIVGLKYQLKGLDFDIKAMKGSSNNIRKQIAIYQERIEETPKREQEMIDLTRDYDNLRLSYESLLTRKIEAEQAAALERRQKGEQFRVIDPARIPVVAFKPDLKKILAMTLLLAAGAGCGLAFGLEFLSKVFYDPDKVAKTLNIPVLACVPLLLTNAEKRKRRLKALFLSLFAVAGYAMVIVLLFVLWSKGPGALKGLF